MKEGHRVMDAPPAPLSNELANVLIRTDVLDFILDEAESSRDGKETGGILIGTDYDDVAEIRRAGGPGPRAVRRADLFSRDTTFAQKLVDEEWQHDGSDWIGEWHTHTRGRPFPSERDRRTYRRFIVAEDLGFARFFSLILVTNTDLWEDVEAVLWEVTQQGLKPCRLTLV
jgi:integrative and conjugative element protein (TIGR02256 family)